ncbi:MAG: hypothetical protein K6T59_09155 [Bryobacteraceae bacterium]|nr:hypothetical protein [Bryobacteraceae bacterium]
METGLYYYRARYYDPHTVRFLSEDPIGFAAGDTNLSRYVFNSPLNYTDPSGMAWSWPVAAAGGAIGAGVAVIGYGIGAWLSGHEVTWKGAAAAAAGGFTAGFIAGGIVGAATGDPTALIGAGALAGLAGAGVQSALHQYLENGTVNWTQLLVDMMFGAALGAISGGITSVLPGAGQALRSSVDDLFWPGGGMALALPGGGAVPAVAPVAGTLSPAAQAQLLGGLTAFSVGLQGGSSPEENTPSSEPYRGATPEDVAAPTRPTPAHPTFQPGPFAGESIPARSPAQVFTPAEHAAINRIGQTTGCHTCGTTNPGTKTGNFVPDHQPPSALNTNNAPQQLYPHCINCSRDQGLAIARQRRSQ